MRNYLLFCIVVVYQYLKYFFASIHNRGFWFTIKLIYNEAKWERKFGINSLSIENLDDKTLASGSIEDTHHYQGASYYILHETFKRLVLPKGAGFVDYGCGKGRALFVAAHYGFSPCIGVELAKELCAIANENILKTKDQFPTTQFQIEFVNALDYKIPTVVSVFYFFNPFPEHVLEKVKNNIISFSETNKKQITIIYVNPKFPEVFSEDCFVKNFEIRSKNYTEAAIYTYSPKLN